jgi:hypothetical protein
MISIKDSIAKTKKFVSNNSDDILVVASAVCTVYTAVFALRLIRDAKVTTGVWKLVITDEIRDQLVEGAKMQTFIIPGKKPTWTIVPPK